MGKENWTVMVPVADSEHFAFADLRVQVGRELPIVLGVELDVLHEPLRTGVQREFLGKRAVEVGPAQHLHRDLELEKLRKRFAPKLARLTEKIEQAEGR